MFGTFLRADNTQASKIDNRSKRENLIDPNLKYTTILIKIIIITNKCRNDNIAGCQCDKFNEWSIKTDSY